MSKKKALLIFFILAFFPLISKAQQQGGIDVGEIIGRVQEILWIVFAGLVTLMFTWAGVKYLLAKGDPSKVSDANKMLIWGVVGAGVGILAYSAMSLVSYLVCGAAQC